MPFKAPHQCNYAGCRALTTTTYCPAHTKTVTRYYDSQRGTSTERGYDSMWQRNSKQFLKENPLCDECYKHKRLTPATVVHHIIDHKGNDELFWNKDNWQALCKVCHDKTRKHKGMGE
jgi:5-methylcytosine-specific restriction protein A